MCCELRTLIPALLLAIIAGTLGEPHKRAEGKTYQFTSQVTAVISPETPWAVSELPFAIGQRVSGTFRYTPDDAVLNGPPSDGYASFIGGFTALSLDIDLGTTFYSFSAPDSVPSDAPFFSGLPLNRITIADNIPISGAGRLDRISLDHQNQLFMDQPMGDVAPSAFIGQFFPGNFFMSWRSETLSARSVPDLVTDFKLPGNLNELFERSESDNWGLQFIELPASGSSSPSIRINVLGRIESLTIIPEPATCGIVCSAFMVVATFPARRCSPASGRHLSW